MLIFPFFDRFPMLPYLNHTNRRKIDISFIYEDKDKNLKFKIINKWLWYFWKIQKWRNKSILNLQARWFLQYHYTKYFTLVSNSKSLKLSRPKTLINKILSNANLSTIFIETHLKNSVHLNNSKRRLHGCRAVRYGDHIHF